MFRHPDGEAGHAGGSEQRHRASLAPRHHQGQRARPEQFGQLARLGAELTQSNRIFERGHMDDQRVEARPALGGEDLGDRLIAGCVGAQAIDGLGRKGDEPARDQGFGSLGDGLGQTCFPGCN